MIYVLFFVYVTLQYVINKDKSIKEVLLLLLADFSDILKKWLAEHIKEEMRELLVD